MIEITDAAEHHYIRDKQHGFNAFDAEEACYKLEKCRDMLLVGLASYGEVERVWYAQQQCESTIPDDLRVLDPTGNCTTTGEFAEALRYVDILMHEIRDHTEAPKEVQS
jgi:hypothetical protein